MLQLLHACYFIVWSCHLPSPVDGIIIYGLVIEICLSTEYASLCAIILDLTAMARPIIIDQTDSNIDDKK